MTKQRLRVLALGVLVVVLAIIGVIVWRRQAEVVALRAHQAEVTARRTQAQERIDTLTEQQAHITDIEAQFAAGLGSYIASSDEARAASQTRHDSSDDDVKTAQAKKELADVNAMSDMVSAQQSLLDEDSDAYANVLGEGAVAAFRADAAQIVADMQFSHNRWWRAIQDITDSRVNGGSDISGETVERLYDESNDYDARAATQFSELTRQMKGLRRQLQGRIDGAKRDLAAIQ